MSHEHLILIVVLSVHMVSRSKEDDIDKYIAEADALAKGPTNIFKKIGDDKLDRLTSAYEKYALAINLSICNGDRSKVLELAEKKLNVLKKTPEVTQYEVGSEYIKLAELQEKTDIDRSIESYLAGMTIFSEIGEFNRRQKYLIKIAKLYEKIGKNSEALDCYIKSCNSDTNNYKAHVEIARLNVELKNYNIALEYYDKIINECLDNTLLKFSCKEHYLNATLCGICEKGIDFKEKYNEFLSTPTFDGSIEANLLKTIFASIENVDEEMFQGAIFEYDKLKKLDDIQVKMLLTIKNEVLLKGDELL